MSQPRLELLGITGDEEALYRRLLRQSVGDDHDQVAGTTDRTGTTDGTAARTADRLVELGLATRNRTGVLRPVAPARAVEHLIDNRLDALREELDDAVRTSGVVESLQQERRTAPARRPPGEAHVIQQIEGMDAVRAVIDELTFFARSESLTTNPTGIISRESADFSRPVDLRVLRRGVRMRTLMAAPALDDRATLTYLHELAGKGAEIRISHQPLERMIICDRSAALTPLDRAHTAKGALLIREPGLVATLVALFDRMWAMAQELPTPDDEPPTEIERRILRSLYTADKDESGARDLGISVRTYRKHVASLMARLRATNRFQAALLAQERGWL
ncbi:helix-turn-helix transcriptional regulator [Streptomyces marokkonensis]|uniref:Helix-turn-helix transcriptional regulator n=1 Tax=Streptomyces marokkonensis TaxID=324855 RepID=A0ABP7Q306_9ACTN